MKDADLPDGVFTNLYTTHAQPDRIIADPQICGVTLTGSEAAGARVASQAGLHINQPTMPSPCIQFGGIKNSGYGHEMGADGIREFVNHKVINGARVAEAA